MSKKKDVPEAVVPLVGLSFGGMSFDGAAPAPATQLTLTRVTEPSKTVSDALCGGTFDEKTLTFVGGLGRDCVITSSDGETFTSITTSGRGLRSMVRDGDTTWVCGEYGTLFKAPNDLSSFEQVRTGTSACLHGTAKTADGAIWVGGDSGFLIRSVNGKKFAPVEGIPGTVRKMVVTPDGLLLPTKKGLFIVPAEGPPKKLSAGDVNHVAVTRAGTYVAVCNGNGIRRSTNGGRTFKPIAVPEFVPMTPEVKLPRPSWIGESQDLNVIAELDDGRLVVGGDGGVVLVSADDGATFQRVEHTLSGGSFWGIGRWNGKVFLAGENRIVLRAS